MCTLLIAWRAMLFVYGDRGFLCESLSEVNKQLNVFISKAATVARYTYHNVVLGFPIPLFTLKLINCIELCSECLTLVLTNHHGKYFWTSVSWFQFESTAGISFRSFANEVSETFLVQSLNWYQKVSVKDVNASFRRFWFFSIWPGMRFSTKSDIQLLPCHYSPTMMHGLHL